VTWEAALGLARKIFGSVSWDRRSSVARPCRGRNSNVCVAEGCYGESCVRRG
jgi:hypothetical protein